MGWFNNGRICLILGLCIVRSSLATKSVDILPNPLKSLEEEEIIRALPQNEADSSENITFVELVGNLANHSKIENHQDNSQDKNGVWRVQENSEVHRTNPYYKAFTDEIDLEAKRFLQIVPTYNPAGGSVSEGCKKQVEIYQRELKKFSLWALKMYDATAKLPSGILSGNINQYGDFDECIGIEGSEGVKGQYCLAFLQLDIDESRPDLKHIHRLVHSHYAFKSNMSDPGHRIPRFMSVNWGVCSPAACSSKDVEISLKDILAKHTADTGLKISVRVDESMCQVRRTEPLPTETIIVGIFFIGVIVLSIFAAICDHYNANVSEILLSFSLKRNVKKLISLTPGDGDIGTLHGIRTLNAVMLIVAHRSMSLFFDPYINRTAMTEFVGKPWTVIGRAASLYTDLFIMLSGLLTTYAFVGRLKKTGKLDVKKEYLSRLMRLVPTLGALILFCTHILPFLSSGPQWNLVVTHHADICKKTWWRNFLFIHNYFGFENMCLTHTHHLGIDTQLFALSPLMVMLLYKRPKFGSLFLIFVALISTVLRYSVTIQRNLNNYVSFGTSIQQLFDTANFSYILPTHRLTVYIIGVFMGYLLRTYPVNFKMSNTVLNIGWIVSSLMTLAAFVGPAEMGSINYVYNSTDAALYSAFAPIGWCMIFAWMAFISHTGNGGGWLCDFFAWRGFLIFTRLSYAIYLTQFPVFFFNVGETRNSGHYGFFKMMFNTNELFWIVITSIVLTLLFDTPFQNIKNHFLKKTSSGPRMAAKSTKEN